MFWFDNVVLNWIHFHISSTVFFMIVSLNLHLVFASSRFSSLKVQAWHVTFAQMWEEALVNLLKVLTHVALCTYSVLSIMLMLAAVLHSSVNTNKPVLSVSMLPENKRPRCCTTGSVNALVRGEERAWCKLTWHVVVATSNSVFM